MKRFKFMPVLLSIAVCMSLFMTPVAVMADESSVPSEEQNAVTTDEAEPEKTEKKGTEATKEEKASSEKEKIAETTEETKDSELKAEESADSQETVPSETDEKETGMDGDSDCGNAVRSFGAGRGRPENLRTQ